LLTEFLLGHSKCKLTLQQEIKMIGSDIQNSADECSAYHHRVITRAFERVAGGNISTKIGNALANGWQLRVEFPPVVPDNKSPLHFAAWIFGGCDYDRPFQSADVEDVEANAAFKNFRSQLEGWGLNINSIEPYEAGVYCAGVKLGLKPS
jgi:hypothetical protein